MHVLDRIKDRALSYLWHKFGNLWHHYRHQSTAPTDWCGLWLLKGARVRQWKDQTKIGWKRFEMKALRQTLQVSWMAKKTDSWVLEQAGVNKSLLANVKSRRLRFWSYHERRRKISLIPTPFGDISRLICSRTTLPSTNCYNPCLRFELLFWHMARYKHRLLRPT